jgi:formylglycine-generating enzyme required for sulfatase activity
VGGQTFDTVMPVGYYSGSPSPYGAFDMAGNVMEWCQDWYDRDYYSVSPRKNPKGPATGAYRVVRGGSFFVEAFDLRTTSRSMAWPSFQAHRMIGFRPVRAINVPAGTPGWPPCSDFFNDRAGNSQCKVVLNRY